ncbi:hypothetical protein PAAG_12084 [Paracoccidioides lutzii Pb01]|uniref:Uncharacterized protein n=1 Tax=Paracoccidioides lutzii (strain ATCC MYA-826 / Pb01) TaxID=502779 RepID=A0A0A2V0C0_PARBA|nr:hypothetical protein PAAG_12084 [Paracoccidioides lutzii Pb01]KGQ01226.1 hypothetical protein PAAG_12084 [Paracoccidioides lutzii Pb01]
MLDILALPGTAGKSRCPARSTEILHTLFVDTRAFRGASMWADKHSNPSTGPQEAAPRPSAQGL